MVTTLKLWLPEELDPYDDTPGADVLAQQLTGFNRAHPDLQVEVTVKRTNGRGGMLDFMRTAREAAPSVLPDLIVVQTSDLETLASSDLIQPLDNVLASAETSDRFPFASEMGTVNDQNLGFVIGADMQLLAYRADTLATPPVSWTQIISPPVPFLFPAGGRDGRVNDATLIQYLGAGGTVTDLDGTPGLERDTMLSVLRFYSACVGSGTISPTVVLSITDPQQAWQRFSNDEAQIAVVQASRYWRDTLDDEPTEPSVAAASLPTRDGHPLTIVREAWAIALVTDDPERQMLTKTLLDWLIDPSHNTQWTQAAGYLPARRSTLRMWSILDVDRVTLRGVLEAAVVAPPDEVMSTVGPAMQQALEAVLKGQATPEEATDAAIQRLEE